MTRKSLTQEQIRELLEADNGSDEDEAPEHEGMEDLLGDDVENIIESENEIATEELLHLTKLNINYFHN